MCVVTEEVVIHDTVPPSLATFQQNDARDTNGGPVKRRKVSQSRPNSLAQEYGISATGVPVGYIPLKRLVLRMNFEIAADSNCDDVNIVTNSLHRIPVTVRITNSPQLAEDSTIAPEHDNYSLELSTTDIERKEIFTHTFNDPRVFGFFQQLKLVRELSSADRYHNRIPIACYQSVLHQTPNKKLYVLETTVLWEDSLEIPDLVHLPNPVLEVFAKYVLQEQYDRPITLEQQRELRERILGSPKTWSPREFYDNVYVPPNTDIASTDIKCPQLTCTLYPFQKRAVRWLLQREEKDIQPDGKVVPIKNGSHASLPVSFKEMKDADGGTCFFSHLFMVVTTDISQWYDAGDHLRGGILAEEMGLGKTVEMITLICLNHRLLEQPPPKPEPDGLRVSGATLIITPPAILEQWKQELDQHAPDLRVHHYTGVKRNQEGSDDLIIEELADSDVVLTTYNVISREIHYAGATPKRSLRHKKRFEVRKTPLVRISWWRVCLDEAQMIESGVSNAAKVARLIPRQHAWAVTGTPLRKDINDLFGLLLFLHYGPFCYSGPLWKRLYSRFGSVLVNIINTIALRHSKDRVRDELLLPPQNRIVITTPFTAVEEQHYSQLFEEMCEQCGLDATGAPLRGDWNPNEPGTVERMRTWLSRLRQTCLHPQLGGSGSNRPLRTVDEVLEVMIESNDTAIRAEERALLLSQLRRGQLLENAKRRKESLALWQNALEHATVLVEDSRTQLRMQRLKIRPAGSVADGTPADGMSDDEIEEADKNNRLVQYRFKLRAALEVQHIAVFFVANAYYQIKSDPSLTEPDTDEFRFFEKREEEGYEAAKLIRKEMLTDISRKVKRYMKTISEKTQKKQFVHIPKMKPHIYSRGLESYRLLNKFEDLCTALNANAEQYNEWRDVMVKLVSQSLIDQEENAELEGNEYEWSTKHQDEMYVYMESLRCMYADRNDALTGQRNTLISHEVKMGIIQAQKGEGPSPQLFLSIMKRRSELIPDPQLGSLRGIVSELRSLATSLEWQASGSSSRARAELELVGMILKNAGQMLSEQLKVSTNLEREVEMFRDTMNNRLEYYRQMQQISDTVAPFDEESAGKPLDEILFAEKLQQEEGIDAKISSLRSKRRYLIHLRDESDPEDSSRICIICQSSFEIGVMTVCGHKYCKDCLRLWRRQHRTCPTCKKFLKFNDFHQISYKPKELVAQEEGSPIEFDHERHLHSTNGIYRDISSGLLREINNIELNGSFGTKIDTLARHIMWLREHDPGAKSIVFSQYRNFLAVLGGAFSQFQIVTSSVDTPGGIERFKKDPAIECFLMHGKAQSSGLTLINATHVFLCEPLINTAIELQAIARVHRIGQHRPTTVWMYLVSGTVEESIYELSVARRLAHIIEKERKESEKQLTDHSVPLDGDEALINGLTETAIESANSREMQDASLTNLMASGSSGGELVRQADLWQCLFGNSTRKDDSHSAEVEREIGRFLRGEAAEQRKNDSL